MRGDGGQARVDGEQQSGRRMGRIQFAKNDVVANVGPAGLAHEFEPQAAALADAEFHRRNQRRTIEQRHVTHTQQGLPTLTGGG